MEPGRSRPTGIPLSRLLARRDVEALFESFLALAHDTGAALVDLDGHLVVTRGHWPQGAPDELAGLGRGSRWTEALTDAEVIEHGPYRLHPLLADSGLVGALVTTTSRSGSVDPAVERALHRSVSLLLREVLARRHIANETLDRYRELSLLYRVGETIGTLRDPAAIPGLVLEESRRVIAADAGVLLLVNPEGDWETRGGFGDQAATIALHEVARFALDRAPDGGKPAIITELPGSASLYSAVLWAPKRIGERLLGGILLGRRHGQPVFTASDARLLCALAAQASLATENAQLFDNLHRTLDETVETRNLLAGILASIPSGVITTDALCRVTQINPAAQRIFGVTEAHAADELMERALPFLFRRVRPHLDAAIREGRTTLVVEHSLLLRDRGPLHINVSCTPLRETDGRVRGATLVVNDVTEQRVLQAEHQRIHAAFGRVVAPRVRDRLLAHSANLRLDGARQTITVLFADIRQFTPYTERTPPESLFRVLNSYLSLAAQAILELEGTLDKFIGDAVMAFWNAPDAQADHALRAAQASLAMQRAFKVHRASLDPEHRLEFSIGIATGEAMVGNVGTSDLFNYTVIGDTVNLAQRLESIAAPGQIILSAAAFRTIADRVVAEELRPVHVKGRRDEEVAYALAGLR